MEHVPVKSSSISHVGYDPSAKVLAVTFSNGTRYHYEGVTPQAHQSLLGANSIGQHFAANIRNQYRGRRA